jgi:hypothetical protein
MAEPAFNIITPQPFSLSNMSREHKDKIRDEVMDKVKTWENRMAVRFFKEYFIASDSWRIRPSDNSNSKTKFNSKSGETHRATETLASVWQRMLTASDPWFETSRRGLNPGGTPITEEQLYATSQILQQQQRALRFKRKLMRSLRSTGLMGVCVAELPYTSLPYGYGAKNIEFTDWVHRPMIRVGFDTTVYDIYESDFIFFVDFQSKWMLKNLASQSTEFWAQDIVEKHIREYAKGAPTTKTDIWQRLQESRNRAGYTDQDSEVYENISYHGRLDSDNPIVQAYAESEGIENPEYVDFSVNILDGEDVAKFHVTQYGDWRTRAKVLSYKDFEDEPIPYGVGALGRKLQRMMDVGESLADDKATFDVLNMWKVGKYSGYDAKQFIAEPLKAVELEDITQLAPLIGDPQVLGQILSLINIRREDFRNIVGAQTNLQAQITKASATESAIAQTEAIRGAGVHAELLGDTLREYLEVSHVNNLNYLDEPIWVGLTGTKKPMLVNKSILPINIGFEVKMTTDKDFRPEERRDMMQALQILNSAQNVFSPQLQINATKELIKELFRKFGRNPAILDEPVDVQEMMEGRLNRAISSGRTPDELAGIEGMVNGEQANLMKTPVGLVPTSPNQDNPEVSA